MSPISPFKKAIVLAGGPTALARQLGVERQNVANWCRRGVPADRCIDVERAVGGAVTRHELRPDVFGVGAPPGEGGPQELRRRPAANTGIAAQATPVVAVDKAA